MFSKKRPLQILDRFLNLAGNEEISELRTLRFSALVFIQAALVAIIFIPIHSAAPEGGTLWISWVCLITSISSLILIRHKRFQLISKLIFIVLMNIWILAVVQVFGPGSQIQFFFTSSSALPFAMFTANQRRALFFSTLLPIVLTVISLIPEFQLLRFLAPPPEILRNYAIVSSVLSLMMVWVSFLYFYKMQDASNREIKEKSAALIQSEKLRTLGVVAGGMAHEINNPLTIISGHINRIKIYYRQKNENIPTAIEESLNKMIETVHRIAAIIKSLRAFSRDTTNDQLTPINPKDSIQDAILLVNQKALLVGVEIELEVQSDFLVYAKQGELLQIFLNLLGNAIDAAANADQHWVKVEVHADEDKGRISIIDSGLGISDNEIRNLFVPFYTTKPVGKGTGLGLSICKGILSSIAGDLIYEKINGHTAFTIEVPLAAPAANMGSSAKSA